MILYVVQKWMWNKMPLLINYPCTQVADKGVDTLHLSLDAKNHPEMPIVGYRVQFKEAGEEWSLAQTAEFKKGLSQICEDEWLSVRKD